MTSVTCNMCGAKQQHPAVCAARERQPEYVHVKHAGASVNRATSLLDPRLHRSASTVSCAAVELCRPLTVRARQRTAFPFTSATRVGIDPLLLMFDAAWMYCTNDGTLPAQAAKYELLIRKRRQMAISRFNNQPIPLDNRLPTDILDIDQSSSFFIPVTH